MARYSTDGSWHVPHFEKMLYDQAQLTVAFSQVKKSSSNHGSVVDIPWFSLGHAEVWPKSAHWHCTEHPTNLEVYFSFRQTAI